MSSDAPDDDWREGEDGRRPRHVERLHASWWLWAVGALLAASVGVAYSYALGPVAGTAAFVVLAALAVWLLLATAPRVRVDERVLRAGRARLPHRYVGTVTVLDAEQTRRLRGVDADPRAYLCLRTSVPATVRVEVTDPADPHPYWLVSTRDPDGLLRALTEPDRLAG